MFIVAAYDCAQKYGGPEEGGWWYDAGSLIRPVKMFRTEEAAYAFCNRLNKRLQSRAFGPNEGRREYTSAASDGEVRALVFENSLPAGFPERRPHYE